MEFQSMEQNKLGGARYTLVSIVYQRKATTALRGKNSLKNPLKNFLTSLLLIDSAVYLTSRGQFHILVSPQMFSKN